MFYSASSQTDLTDVRHMRIKLYKVRSLAVENGKTTCIDLRVEFEGKRAFAIWDSIPMGNFELKVRLELDPKCLERGGGPCSDFFYRGQLVLPRPQDN